LQENLIRNPEKKTPSQDMLIRNPEKKNPSQDMSIRNPRKTTPSQDMQIWNPEKTKPSQDMSIRKPEKKTRISGHVHLLIHVSLYKSSGLEALVSAQQLQRNLIRNPKIPTSEHVRQEPRKEKPISGYGNQEPRKKKLLSQDM
jgi:hypothetical protein